MDGVAAGLEDRSRWGGWDGWPGGDIGFNLLASRQRCGLLCLRGGGVV